MFDHDSLREYCLAKPGTSEDFPFGEEVLALRVRGKIFALSNIFDRPMAVNLKCDPERALELRGEWAAVKPGYHMNKKHWNTVTFDGSMPATLLEELIDHSYALVVKTLKKPDREALAAASE